MDITESNAHGQMHTFSMTFPIMNFEGSNSKAHKVRLKNLDFPWTKAARSICGLGDSHFLLEFRWIFFHVTDI